MGRQCRPDLASRSGSSSTFEGKETAEEGKQASLQRHEQPSSNTCEFQDQSCFPLNGLANISRDQGKDEQAMPLSQHALSIRKRQRGEHHLETAESLHDFARFLEARKQPEEALALYLQALTMCEQQLGLQHPRTGDTRTRAIQLLRKNGRTEEAVALETAPMQKGITNNRAVS